MAKITKGRILEVILKVAVHLYLSEEIDDDGDDDDYKYGLL